MEFVPIPLHPITGDSVDLFPHVRIVPLSGFLSAVPPNYMDVQQFDGRPNAGVFLPPNWSFAWNDLEFEVDI